MDASVKTSVQSIERKRAMTATMKGLIFLAPSILLFAVFTIAPFINTIIQSFFVTDVRGGLVMFDGFNNYLTLFQDPVYLKAIQNTFVFALLTIPATVGLALLLAVVSSEPLKGVGFFKTIFSFTMGISVAAGSLFWSLLYHPNAGLINKFLGLFGIPAVSWLTDPHWALFSVSIITIWMNLGFSYLILLGGIKNVDRSYYESAELVGAGFWYKLRKITIPLISPSLFFVLTIAIINSFQTFGVIDMLTQGGPTNATNLLVYNLYNDAFVNFRYDAASAQGVVLFLMIFLITKLQTRLTERWVTYQ